MGELLNRLTSTVHRNRGRLVAAVVLVVGLYFVVAFGEQAWRARGLETEVAGREAAIATMQAKRDALQHQLAQYQSDQYDAYVERVARRDLNLARPGETVIMTHLLPAPTPTPTPASKAGGQPAHKANWQGWLELFGLR